MARSRSIRVTPNMQRCLKILEEAVRSLPPGDLKKRAKGAVGYMSRTFKGEPQPKKGRICPSGLPIIPPG